MKNTIATIATALLMTLSFSFAHASNNPLKTKDAKGILITYVESSSVGNTDYNNLLFTADFQYENTANKTKHTKTSYLKFLKENEGIVNNCRTSYEILDATNSIAIAKSTSTFDTFTRVDHITLTNSKDGWKISKVTTSYK